MAIGIVKQEQRSPDGGGEGEGGGGALFANRNTQAWRVAYIFERKRMYARANKYESWQEAIEPSSVESSKITRLADRVHTLSGRLVPLEVVLCND